MVSSTSSTLRRKLSIRPSSARGLPMERMKPRSPKQFRSLPHLHPRPRSSTPVKMAAAGRQPRAKRFPAVLSEYKSTLLVSWPFPKPQKLPRYLTSHEAAHLGVPPMTKVLTCESRNNRDDEDFNNDTKWSAKLGILRTEQEFVEEAIHLSPL